MSANKYDTLFLIAQAVKSGLPLAEAIRLSVGELTGSHDRKLLRFAELLDKGIPPQDAVKQAALPKSVSNLFDVALTSKDFIGTFDELAGLEINRYQTIRNIVQALAYPMLLMVVTLVTIWGLLVFTVPQFESIYEDFGTELPVITSQLISWSHVLTNPLKNLVIAGTIVVVFFIAIPLLFPRFYFCIPILGNVLRSMYSARFLRQLGKLIQQNVPLPDALEQCGKVFRNIAYRRDCRRAAAAARLGMDLPEIICRYYWLFPAWLAPVIDTDGSSESLHKSFRRAAETVEQQRDHSILFLQVLSLPLFLMTMCSIVFLFTLALFMPLIALISDLSV